MRALASALLVSMVLAEEAHADSGDSAAARILFDEARKLMKLGKYDEACPKLEEGVRLNPGLGMRFNLAECWEHQGKSASAWSLYLDVAASAKQKNEPKREKIARDAAKKLEGKLARVTIELEGETPGLTVERNGAIVGAGQLGVAVPVDPGTYTIEASAPEHRAWTTKVDLVEAASLTVRVPKLALLPKPPPSPPPPKPVEHSGLGPTRILAIGLAGAGVVGLGIGTFFGARALTLNGDSRAHCAGNVCDQEGFEKRLDARKAGSTSTVALIAGAVGVGIGAALWLTAPKAERATPTAIVLPGYAGLGVSGNF